MADPTTVITSSTNHVIMIPQDLWGLAIIIGLVGGLAGGIGSALQEELDTARRDKRSVFSDKRDRTLFIEGLLGRGCVGAVTGLGGLFIVLLSPITASFGDGAFWAFLSGASTLFGIFSTRLLPAIERSFGRRIGLIEEEIGKVHFEVASNTGLDKAERALDDALSAWAVKSDIRKHAAIADDYIRKFPRTRRPNLRYARVFFEKLKDKGSCIAATTRFITYLDQMSTDQKDQEVSKDLADALYNRACYHVSSPGEGAVLLNENYIPSAEEITLAMFDIKRSFDLSPENKADAREDIYFTWLSNNSEDFRKILE